jgi:hypothetical protein
MPTSTNTSSASSENTPFITSATTASSLSRKRVLGITSVTFLVYFNVCGGPWGSEEMMSDAGPLPGMVVVSTVLKSAETGEVIGECQTLVYGYNQYDKVHGFSCFKK